MSRKRKFTTIWGLGSLLLLLAALFSGPIFGSGDEGGGGNLNLTPFSRVAVIGPFANPVDAYGEAKEVATFIATYVVDFNDVTEHDFDANWILGGYEEGGDVTIEEAILRVPTPYKIDPETDMSPINRKKVNIVEMCNPLFAKKALGVLPIVKTDDKSISIINGYIHAPALPCEVAIYAEEDGYVYVEMLNPEAIFTLFFTDVLFGEQMDDPDFAAEIQALPAQVNYEIRTIIYAALGGAGVVYTPASDPLGPVYHSMQQVAQVVEETPYESPYAHFAYEKKDGSDFSDLEVAFIADQIIATLSLDGVHHPRLDARLNMDDWRSARPHPLPIPGNLVIEACSPTNAIAAMELGMYHAPALPCQIAVKAVSYDGVEGNETLLITYLDPHFMFSALFSDAFGDLTEDELEKLMELPPAVLEDLQTVVKVALKPRNLREFDPPIKLKQRPDQLFFDMLGEDDDSDDDDDDSDDDD